MNSRKHSAFAYCVGALYACLGAVIALVVVFLRDGTDFYHKATQGDFPLPTPALLAMGALLFACAALVLRAVGVDRAERVLAQRSRSVLLLLSVAVLILQGVVAVHAGFNSSNDAQSVLDAAYAYGLGLPQYIDRAYFAQYPNNVPLAVLYGAFLRVICLIFGIEPGKERFALMLTLVQSALNVLTGVLLFNVTRAYAARLGLRAHLTAWCAYALYFVLIACSPWFLVTYSDSAAIVIPIACILLCERAQRSNTRGGIARMALLGALGALGFLIKPQAAIPLIAVLMCEGASLILRRSARSAAHLAAALLAAAFILVPVRSAVFASAQLDPNPPQAMVASHYFNMGLNPKTDGMYDSEDVNRATLAKDQQERTRLSLETALTRIRDYGPAGLAAHLLKKTLLNFSDGGFTWCVDYRGNERPPRNAFSVLVRSVVYDDGAHYPLLHTLQQIAWLLVLSLSPFAALSLRGASEDARHALCVPMLSIVGIIGFNMLFEARARYMYDMASVLVLLFALSCSSLLGARRGTRPGGHESRLLKAKSVLCMRKDQTHRKGESIHGGLPNVQDSAVDVSAMCAARRRRKADERTVDGAGVLA